MGARSLGPMVITSVEGEASTKVRCPRFLSDVQNFTKNKISIM
jgi:hypothetical protein